MDCEIFHKLAHSPTCKSQRSIFQLEHLQMFLTPNFSGRGKIFSIYDELGYGWKWSLAITEEQWEEVKGVQAASNLYQAPPDAVHSAASI